MKKRTLLAVAIALIGGSATAGNQLYQPSSSAVTAGGLANSKLHSAGRYNPAATYVNTNRVRLSILEGAVGVSMQGLGTIPDALDALSEEGDEFQRLLDDFQDDNGNTTSGEVLDQIDVLEATIDQNVKNMADALVVNASAVGGVPLLPVQVQLPFLDGPVSFGISYLTSGRGNMLHSAVSFNIDESALDDSGDDFDPADFLTTASSMYVKTGRAWNFDLAYAQPIPGIDLLGTDVIVGGRTTLIASHLSKELYPIRGLISESTTDDGDTDAYFSMVQDDITEGLLTGELGFTVSLDLGLVLQGPNGHVGLTGYNLNSPEVSYNVLGVDCVNITDTRKQDACFYADYFDSIGTISAQETHVMSPRFTLDAGRQFLNNSIVLGTTVDLNPGMDMFGDQSQILGASMLLQPNRWYAPSARLGVQKDLKDFTPTTYALGLSLFSILHADVAASGVLGDLLTGDDEAQANALRGVAASLSLNASF